MLLLLGPSSTDCTSVQPAPHRNDTDGSTPPSCNNSAWMHRSRYSVDAKKGQNFNHAHGPIRAKHWPIRAKSVVNLPLCRDERLPHFDGPARVQCERTSVVMKECPILTGQQVHPASAMRARVASDQRLPHFDGPGKVRPASAMRAHVASRPVRDVEPGTMLQGRCLAFGAEFELSLIHI